MIEKFKLSWTLFKASVQVTLRHKRLLWFPFVTMCITMVIALFFISALVLPYVLLHSGHGTQMAHWTQSAMQNAPNQVYTPLGSAKRLGDTAAKYPLASVWLVAAYFVSMFLATFFNVAFYSEIMAAFDGRGVSLLRGFRAARSRIWSILAWSLLAGLVGWLIRTIEQRLPFLARIFVGMVGLAWSVAAVFAIPVIVTHETERNPLRILQSSARTLKQTWGEGLIAYVGFSAANFVVLGISFVTAVAVCVLGYALQAGVWFFLVAGALWLICFLAFSYLSGVAGHVFRCALYKYATEGAVPEPFNPEWMDMAWKVKGGPAQG